MQNTFTFIETDQKSVFFFSSEKLFFLNPSRKLVLELRSQLMIGARTEESIRVEVLKVCLGCVFTPINRQKIVSLCTFSKDLFVPLRLTS